MAEPTFLDRLAAADKELESAGAAVKGLDPFGTIRTKLDVARGALSDLMGIVGEVTRLATSNLPGSDAGVRTEADRVPGRKETPASKAK